MGQFQWHPDWRKVQWHRINRQSTFRAYAEISFYCESFDILSDVFALKIMKINSRQNDIDLMLVNKEFVIGHIVFRDISRF